MIVTYQYHYLFSTCFVRGCVYNGGGQQRSIRSSYFLESMRFPSFVRMMQPGKFPIGSLDLGRFRIFRNPQNFVWQFFLCLLRIIDPVLVVLMTVVDQCHIQHGKLHRSLDVIPFHLLGVFFRQFGKRRVDGRTQLVSLDSLLTTPFLDSLENTGVACRRWIRSTRIMEIGRRNNDFIVFLCRQGDHRVSYLLPILLVVAVVVSALA
mmetsp:Transcript_3537/g.9952  ORF Transcript_3537/g.9952 Transcript_3537/m.9952 type:complete len:207 (-) Transcript_3537:482-1102(-)